MLYRRKQIASKTKLKFVVCFWNSSHCSIIFVAFELGVCMRDFVASAIFWPQTFFRRCNHDCHCACADSWPRRKAYFPFHILLEVLTLLYTQSEVSRGLFSSPYVFSAFLLFEHIMSIHTDPSCSILHAGSGLGGSEYHRGAVIAWHSSPAAWFPTSNGAGGGVRPHCCDGLAFWAALLG